MVPLGTSSQPPASQEDGGRNDTTEAGVRAEDAGRSRLQTALAYLMAVVLTGATLLLRLALSSRFGDHPALELFLIPIILSAAAGGLGPGLVATALVAVATDYYLLPPKHSFAIASGLHSLEWLVLILAGTLMSVLLRKRPRGSPDAAESSFGNERPEMSSDSESSVSRMILISAGSTCAALGAVSLVGWFFHIAALTRVGPSLNPMMANTALGLFLDGVALLFLAAGRPKAALGGAVWSLLAGILTLAEFGFSINLHIDELLVRDYIRAVPASPGRPAPNAALCLLFCGVALLWVSMPRWREKAAVIIGVLGAVVFALGAAAVSGYVLGLPMYALGDSKPMAANAGLGFVALGLGVMALAWRRSQPSPEAEARILFSAERKVRAGFALALAALILIGGTSYFSLVKLHEDRVWVDHTRQVIASLQLVLFDITEARAEQRSYIVTRDEQYLASYRKAVQKLAGHLRGLRPLTADNPGQQSRLDMLAPLVAARLAVLQEGIERLGNRDSAMATVIFARGQQLDERVRGLLADMEAAEETLLEERRTRARHAGTVAKTVIVAGITLAFVFVVVALFVISADFAGSRRARAALQEARDQLETRVQERTAELAKANLTSQNSEERLAGVINSAMDGIVTVDEQQRIVLFNPSAEKMFGCAAADALGQPLDRFIPESLRSAHARHIQDFGETHVTRRQMGALGSISGVHANGEEFPIEAAISRVDVAGRTLFTAIVRDITERKRAEEGTRKSEERLHLALRHANAGIWEWDLRTNQNTWSEEVWRLYGLEPHSCEPSYDAWLGAVHPHDRAPTAGRVHEAASRGSELSLEYRTSGRNGAMRWLLARGQPIRDASGKPIRYLGVVLDITERKRAQEKLVEAHRRTTAILESISDGFNTFDREWRYTHVNAAAAKMLGKAPAELLGKNIWELWPHAADSPFGVAYRRAVAENVPLQVEAFYPEPLNAWFEVRCYPSPEGLALFFTDTTERKRAEQEIRLLNRDLERRVAERTAELEAANRELESFSYTVSHDLRAPLRTMDGFSDALLEDYGPQLPAEARDYLATIRRGAQRMGTLIDDLLAFSQLGRKPLVRQFVNMEALVHGALEELGPERNGIQFVNGDLPPAHGDPALLKQVWMNLLSNAIKYSRHAEQARIEIGSQAEARAMVYFVRDNGAGFDMKYAGKLFGVFQRLHRADEFEGTGIGLATVQRIVHRHGGRVWAEAQPDQGATFYFTLEGEE